MQDPHRPTALHAALQFVINSEIPSQHKATLIEVLTQTLRDDETAELRRRSAAAQTRREWLEPEIAQLRSFLQDRVARSWQHADECVMQAAAQLQRDPRSVRDKAVELGLDASVDYRYAKALRKVGEE